jgi:hypothetical protein
MTNDERMTQFEQPRHVQPIKKPGRAPQGAGLGSWTGPEKDTAAPADGSVPSGFRAASLQSIGEALRRAADENLPAAISRRALAHGFFGEPDASAYRLIGYELVCRSPKMVGLRIP